MENKEKYNFADFTTDSYRNLLFKANQQYTVTDFHNYHSVSNFIILRHDVDFSINRALRLAQIESELGLKSTFLILLHCEFYNVFEKETSLKIKQIIDMGHEVGLHFDSHFYDIDSLDELEKRLLFEKQILENLFNIKVRVFSFHITNHFTVSCDKESYGGMVNAYSEYFQKKIGYCSDSNGYWRFKRMEDLIVSKEFACLQFLTHPVWWSEQIESPKERLWKSIEERAEFCRNWYIDITKKNNREMIDW